jgi:hypothetical protein
MATRIPFPSFCRTTLVDNNRTKKINILEFQKCGFVIARFEVNKSRGQQVIEEDGDPYPAQFDVVR